MQTIKYKTEDLKEGIILTLHEDKEALALATPSGSVASPPSQNTTFDTHMGIPTDAQMAKIKKLTGVESSPEEWFVCTFHASDNLISRSIRSWHPNVLSQMAIALQGKVGMLNHDWEDVDRAIGFIFDTYLAISSDAPLDVINQPGKLDLNRAIVSKNGYQRLYVSFAIASLLTNIIDAIVSRRVNNCSTGGYLTKIKMICPNCSEDKGRDVTFTERDKNDEYVCPHLMPSLYSQIFDDGDDESEQAIADYMILDGVFDGIELSIVQAGNLPAASVVR